MGWPLWGKCHASSWDWLIPPLSEGWGVTPLLAVFRVRGILAKEAGTQRGGLREASLGA